MDSISRSELVGVRGSVRAWLRVEGFAALLLAVWLYHGNDYSWLAFALLFLMPDGSLIGYLGGARIGAATYNVIHSYAGPLLLAVFQLLTHGSLAIPLVWVAHIGFDRLLGYGLKYPSAFQDTHLGPIGKISAAEASRV